MKDYSGFQEVPPDAPVWSHIEAAGGSRSVVKGRLWADLSSMNELGNYDRIMLDPVVVRLHTGAQGNWVSAQKMEEACQFTYNTMLAALEDGYPLVSEPGERVLRIRGAITDLYPSVHFDTPNSDDRPSFTWGNSRPGGATLEGEAVDSLTGKRILGTIGEFRASYFDSLDENKDEWEDARNAVRGICTFIRDRMDEAHLSSPSRTDS